MATARDESGFDEIVIERGTLADFAALERFHYRGERPGGATAVWVARTGRPTALQRYERLAISGQAGMDSNGAKSNRTEGEVVGVLLRGLPDLACAARNVAMGQRYAGLPAREAAILINREVRTIRRVVVDPRYRGLGLAVRLVRTALAEAETKITEALAVMGRAHPFFERAGMTRVEIAPRPADQRLEDALWSAGIDAEDVREGEASAWRRLRELDDGAMAFLLPEVDRWERNAGWNALRRCGGAPGPSASGRAPISAMERRERRIERIVDAVGRAVRPAYYVWERGEGRGGQDDRGERDRGRAAAGARRERERDVEGGDGGAQTEHRAQRAVSRADRSADRGGRRRGA